MRVPEGFLIGAATSSYQIEGGWDADGKGPSIWDTFVREPGRIHDGDTGDVACDHYHRWSDDLDLMASYGLQGYRFSLSWPRVMPSGTGVVNEPGLDFYDRLVDGLLERGIRPFATLYHWDLPQALQDRGGWAERATAEHFAAYADACARRLGDRVKDWSTLNEQHVVAMVGHAHGAFAPGHRDPAEALRVAHVLSLAHGRACQAIRAVQPDARLSIVHNIAASRPETDDPADVAARDDWDLVVNEIYLGPQIDGAYPQRLVDLTSHITDWSFVADGDLATIHQPLDAFGLNYYTRLAIAQCREGDDPCGELGLGHVTVRRPQDPRTDIGWTLDAEGLHDQVLRVSQRLRGLPIWITENGAAYDDPVVAGRVHDARRVDYLRTHLDAVLRAREEGARVDGYLAWSLMDNFEWAEGYGQRFGITHVDYDTLVRTPKDSALWLSRVIADGETDVAVPGEE